MKRFRTVRDSHDTWGLFLGCVASWERDPRVQRLFGCASESSWLLRCCSLFLRESLLFRLLNLLVASTLGSALVAQVPGSFVTFGSGCSGRLSTCISLNTSNSGIGGALPNEYCYPVVTTGSTVVIGFEIVLQAASGPFVTSGHLYLEDPSAPGKPSATAAATGPMLLDVAEQFYSCSLASSVVIPANSIFWIAADTPDQHPSSFANGSPHPGSVYWRRPRMDWLPTGYVTNPAYKVRCLNPAGGGSSVGVLQIGAATMPEINKSFDVTLAGGSPKSSAYLFFGASNTALAALPLPFDLGLIGAPGCMILASADAASSPIVVDVTGAATFSMIIPSNGSLVGSTFYLQWLNLDPGANALNVITSNGGEAKIGG